MNFNPGGVETRTIRTVFLPTGPRDKATVVRTTTRVQETGPNGPTGEWNTEMAIVHWVDVTYPEPHTGTQNVITFYGNPLHPSQKDELGNFRQVHPLRELKLQGDDATELIEKVLRYLDLYPGEGSK